MRWARLRWSSIGESMTQTRESGGGRFMRAIVAIFILMALCSRVALGTTATPTPVPCSGDCNQDRQVTIDEILDMVNIALDGTGVSTCRAGDRNGDDAIEVDEIIAAIDAALNGCRPIPTVTPSPTATPLGCGDGHIQPWESCDDGNTVNGDGCSNCQVDPQFMCFREPSECFIVNCPEPNPVCSGGPSTFTPTPTATPTPL
jgi:cysteine-rich repeat protein